MLFPIYIELLVLIRPLRTFGLLDQRDYFTFTFFTRLARFLYFYFFETGNHATHCFERRRSGCSEIDVCYDKGRECPSDQCVYRGKEGKSAEPTSNGRPALYAPHQDTCQSLEWQKHIQNSKVCRLLQRIHLGVRSLCEWMRLALENALDVEQCLFNRVIDETVWARNKLANVTSGEMIEQG